MVVQAVALLDDLDKEINIYAMRVKEWYGWHFPELGKIIVDNLAYAKVIKAMGELPLSSVRLAYSDTFARLPHKRCDDRLLRHPP